MIMIMMAMLIIMMMRFCTPVMMRLLKPSFFWCLAGCQAVSRALIGRDVQLTPSRNSLSFLMLNKFI